MKIAEFRDIKLHYREDGEPDGAPIVFANSLGTDLRLWDPILPLLPKGLRIIRYDNRGHGLSDAPPAPYSMGALVRDAERLLDLLNVRDCIFVGLSVGGMIAQGLAVKRLDQIRGLVLSNTAAKIGGPSLWKPRIEAVEKGGIEAIEEAVLQRWFHKRFHETPEFHLWRNMLMRTPVEGYLGISHAIANTDFYTPTGGLRLPTLGIAGTEDRSTPPDLVRETVNLIPGSKFHMIRKAGHLPCVDQPLEYARILTEFLKETGHI